MKQIFLAALWAVLGLWGLSLRAQTYQYQKGAVTIVRDSFGVPHIYGRTDADAAYGLAWAHCEDAFELIQEQLLAAQGRLAEVKGKQGAIFDFARGFFGIDTLVANRYDSAFSDEYKIVLQGYVQGVNDYARLHPKQIWVKNSFPASAQDVIAGYTLTSVLLSGAGMDLLMLSKNKLPEFHHLNSTGSNSLTVAPHRTEDGKAWLLVNSHQPIQGRFAWYEAHINSEQGWNFIGGLFAGGSSGFVGCNPHLGWAHTTNYHRFGDIYKLELSKNKKSYYYDQQWRKFEYKKIPLRVKIAGVKLPIKKKVPVCDYGSVFKTKHGYYALRYPCAMDIRAAEQWYRMNKARNFEEFEQAVKMQALCLFNINYADTAGNIFLISEGKIPQRDTVKNGQKLSWDLPNIGNSSLYKWDKLLPYERKVRYLNPKAGFLYNCNGSPLFATGYDENSKADYIGIQLFDFNRNEYYGRVLNAKQGKLSWQDFLDIKYNCQYEKTGAYMRNFGILYQLDPYKYPEIAVVLKSLKSWDLNGDRNSRAASIAMLSHYFIAKKAKLPFSLLMIQRDPITEAQAVEGVRAAQRWMLSKFGRIVPLGEIQQLRRGKKAFPIDGLPEVSRSVEVVYDKKTSRFVMDKGDGYYQLAKFGKDGVELETISPFGASCDPKSPHYTDQMELFSNQKTKKMSFDRAQVFRQAKRIYQPQD